MARHEKEKENIFDTFMEVLKKQELRKLEHSSNSNLGNQSDKLWTTTASMGWELYVCICNQVYQIILTK